MGLQGCIVGSRAAFSPGAALKTLDKSGFVVKVFHSRGLVGGNGGGHLGKGIPVRPERRGDGRCGWARLWCGCLRRGCEHSLIQLNGDGKY